MKGLLQKEINDTVYIVTIEEKKFVVLKKEEYLKTYGIHDYLLSKGRMLPFILFVGNSLIPNVEELNAVLFLPVQRNQVVITYKVRGNEKNFQVKIQVNIPYEYYPVYVGYADLSDITALPMKKNFDMIIFSPEIDRLGFLKLRVHFPKSALVRAGENGGKANKEVETTRMVDIVEREGLQFAMKNPVYSARYYLRLLDFESMYELPVKVNCSPEEIEMILSFIDIMYENKQKNPELDAYKKELMDLRIFYQFVLLMVKNDYAGLEQLFYEKEDYINKEIKIRNKLLEFVKAFKEYKVRTKKKLTREEEIELWQIETLLKFKG